VAFTTPKVIISIKTGSTRLAAGTMNRVSMLKDSLCPKDWLLTALATKYPNKTTEMVEL
jgi:hypothetical protein